MEKLGIAPQGYTWDLKSSKLKRGQEDGKAYQILVKQNKSVIIDVRFFISNEEKPKTDEIIRRNEERVRNLINP